MPCRETISNCIHLVVEDERYTVRVVEDPIEIVDFGPRYENNGQFENKETNHDADFPAASVVAESLAVNLENRNRHLLEVDNGLQLINVLNDCENALANTGLASEVHASVVGEELVTVNRAVGTNGGGPGEQLGIKPTCEVANHETKVLGWPGKTVVLARLTKSPDKHAPAGATKEPTRIPLFSSSSSLRAKQHKSAKGDSTSSTTGGKQIRRSILVDKMSLRQVKRVARSKGIRGLGTAAKLSRAAPLVVNDGPATTEVEATGEVSSQGPSLDARRSHHSRSSNEDDFSEKIGFAVLRRSRKMLELLHQEIVLTIIEDFVPQY